MDITTFIKVGRLKWAGHVVRMDQQRPAKRILNAKLEGTRRRGRPKLRWEDGVGKDVKALGERNWKNIARNREIWQKLLRKAMAQKRAVVPMMMMDAKYFEPNQNRKKKSSPEHACKLSLIYEVPMSQDSSASKVTGYLLALILGC
jgi:hypothetical protein